MIVSLLIRQQGSTSFRENIPALEALRKIRDSLVDLPLNSSSSDVMLQEISSH